MLLLASGALLHERYRVEGPLERGGSVEIYLARDEQSAQLVDLQLLSPATPATAVQRHTVVEELARLKHPALPAPIATFHVGNRPVVVTEHVPGTSLEELRARRPGDRLPPRAAVLALLPILDALQLLHTHTPPLPHGAISPATILLGPDGQPRLSGLAATELWSDGAGQSADLYAIGAALYTLLTGSPPSAGVAPGMAPIPPSRLAPEITPALEQALLRLLAGERAGRPESPLVAAQELSAALDPQLCASCGYANRGTAKFCTGCGATLPMADPRTTLLAALQPIDTIAPASIAPPIPPQPTAPQARINDLPTTPLMLARTDQTVPMRGTPPPQPIPIPPPTGAAPARPGNMPPPAIGRVGLPLLLVGGLVLLLTTCVGAGTLLLFRDQGSDPPAQWALGMTAAAAAATPTSDAELAAPAGATAPSAEPTIDDAATSAAGAAAQTAEAAAIQTPAAAATQTAEAALLGQTATALAATALVPPTATVAPEPPRLRFTLGPTDGRPDCVAVVIRGVDTQGWLFRINGLRLEPGAFNGGEYAVACNLGAGREVTINVYDASGNIVPGGEGVPTRGGSTMIADWR